MTKVSIKKPVAATTIVPSKKKMGGMKTEYDVRISVYTSTRKRTNGKNEENGIIMFADSLYELFANASTDRIEIKKEAKRLYFIVNKNGTFGDGTSCITPVPNNKGKLQYSREDSIDILKQFIGEFPLEYDSNKQIYYVDLDHRTDLTNTLSGSFNREHNYPKNKHVIDRGLNRKKTEDEEISVVDVKESDPEVKLELKDDSVDKEQQKQEIFQLLDVLGSDKNNTYAVALVNLIKEKVTSL